MKLLVGVPTHSQTVVVETAVTLLDLQTACQRKGWEMSVEFFGGAVIQEVRNLIAGSFLHRGADVLLMLDADQAVTPQVALRLIDHAGPVTGLFYPRRLFEWSRVRPEETDVARARVAANPFVGQLAAGASDGVFQIVDGFARADFVGTGVLAIRLAAFTRLQAAFPDLEGHGFRAEAGTDPGLPNWGFFNSFRNPDTGLVLGEDYAFCRRWRQAGGEIWADVVSSSQHVGRVRFEGSYLDHVRAGFAVSVDPVSADSPGSSPPP